MQHIKVVLHEKGLCCIPSTPSSSFVENELPLIFLGRTELLRDHKVGMLIDC